MAMLQRMQRTCICRSSTTDRYCIRNLFDFASVTAFSRQRSIGPGAATAASLRTCSTAWGRSSDQAPDGDSWTTVNAETKQKRRRKSRCGGVFNPLSSDRARKDSRSLVWSHAVRRVVTMNSKKDATLPISMPPSTGTMLTEEPKLKSSRMSRRGAIVALSYMVCAVMLVMFNKAALSTYKFPCANVITVLQMVCSTALLYVLRKLDIITFANGGNGTIDSTGDGFVPFRVVKRASPLAISYLFYMVVGMASIRGVNVPMYTTLRRTTVLFTMVLEFFLAGQKHSTPIVSSVGLIILGAFIAGSRDLSFDSHGYLIVLLSNLTTALYLTTISRLGKSTGLNSFGLMWCNGIICGPILLLWTILSGELGMALHFPAILVPSFQLVIMLSCMMAFCLNYTIFLNTSLNSPLTQTMCGNLKDLGTVLIGWVWFGGLPFDWLNVLGQFLGFLGSGLYAYCKLKGI